MTITIQNDDGDDDKVDGNDDDDDDDDESLSDIKCGKVMETSGAK